MRRTWLIPVTMALALGGVVHAADPPADPAVDARIKALEKRVAELEQKLGAMSAAATAPAPAVAQGGAATPSAAPPPGKPAIRITGGAGFKGTAAETSNRWQDSSSWSGLHLGMGWSEVKALLGAPGATTTGIFGDVWFYPDSSGGRVVFDRDSRVSDWSAPGR